MANLFKIDTLNVKLQQLRWFYFLSFGVFFRVGFLFEKISWRMISYGCIK